MDWPFSRSGAELIFANCRHVPSQMNSVLRAFNFHNFNIHVSMSAIHCNRTYSAADLALDNLLHVVCISVNADGNPVDVCRIQDEQQGPKTDPVECTQKTLES